MLLFSTLSNHFFGGLFCFINIIMVLLNLDNPPKTLTFKKSEHLLYKFYPKFVKTFKEHPNKFDIRQFLVFSYDFLSNMNNFWSIDQIFKNEMSYK